MKVQDIMEINFLTVTANTTLTEAARCFTQNKVPDLMIVDNNNIFIGVVSQGDLIRRVLPDLDELKYVSNGMLQKAYEVFLESGKSIAEETIENLVIKQPIILHPEDELLKGAIVMTELQIQSLPVIKNRKLVGVVSRSDICYAILS